MARRIHMNMDSTAIIYLCAAVAKFPDQLLYRGNIFIAANWGNDLHRVQAACCSCSSCLTADAGIADYLPATAISILDGVAVIGASHMNRVSFKMPSQDFCRSISGNPCHLDLNAKVLASQAVSPPWCLPIWPMRRQKGSRGVFFTAFPPLAGLGHHREGFPKKPRHPRRFPCPAGIATAGSPEPRTAALP